MNVVAKTEIHTPGSNTSHKLTILSREYDVIGIDEGQFFPDIVNWCEEMANRCSFWSTNERTRNVKLREEDESEFFRGKIVLVAALDGTFQRLPFPEMLALVPLAEAVTKLQAVCMICFQVHNILGE